MVLTASVCYIHLLFQCLSSHYVTFRWTWFLSARESLISIHYDSAVIVGCCGYDCSLCMTDAAILCYYDYSMSDLRTVNHHLLYL